VGSAELLKAVNAGVDKLMGPQDRLVSRLAAASFR